MTLPPPVDIPTGGCGRRLAFVLLAVLLSVLLPVLLLAGCGPSVVIGLSSLFRPGPLDGFAVSGGTCRVVESGNAQVEIEIASIRDQAGFFRIEPLGTDELTLVGVASLPPDVTLASLDSTGEQELRAQLDDSDDWGRADIKPTSVILEFRRDSRDTRAVLPKLTLWWSSGEPAFVQDVPINLDWSATSCEVAP
jgi:hypothetical protein